MIEQEIKKRLRREYRRKRKTTNIEWFLDHIGAHTLHCDRCKYDKCYSAIHFHHTNSVQKEKPNDSFSQWANSYNLKKFQEKVFAHDFVILCANCHAEYHAGLWTLSGEGL